MSFCPNSKLYSSWVFVSFKIYLPISMFSAFASPFLSVTRCFTIFPFWSIKSNSTPLKFMVLSSLSTFFIVIFPFFLLFFISIIFSSSYSIIISFSVPSKTYCCCVFISLNIIVPCFKLDIVIVPFLSVLKFPIWVPSLYFTLNSTFSIGLFVSTDAKEVRGMDIIPEAIEDAKKNAELSGRKNIHYEVGKAEDLFAKWTKNNFVPDIIK